MPETFIDLRSDTVTRPSAEMRQAMAEAEVGDDVFLEDPTVNRLQERAAEIFGREAGLYVPSGSMGNLACVLAQTEPGQEVICEAEGHVYNYEMGSMVAIAGTIPRLIKTRDGILDWSQIESEIRPPVYYRAQTALISLENTHNMAGGTVYPTDVGHEICERAHEKGLRVHLDGARVFNAAVALDEDVQHMTRHFDSIQFCLSKGLGGPIGSLIVGSQDLIDRCRRFRKMLGGGMRQAGVAAAAGLVALEKGPARLHEDHENAKLLATRLAEVPGIELDAASVRTNIVIFGLSREAAFSSNDFLAQLRDRGVLAVAVDDRRIRMVTHLDVSSDEVKTAVDAVFALMEQRVA